MSNNNRLTEGFLLDFFDILLLPIQYDYVFAFCSRVREHNLVHLLHIVPPPHLPGVRLIPMSLLPLLQHGLFGINSSFTTFGIISLDTFGEICA